MANAANDWLLAANLENGSMSWLLAQAVKYLTKLKWKIVALPGKRMPLRIFREGLDPSSQRKAWSALRFSDHHNASSYSSLRAIGVRMTR
jgi:hypothetical protein